MEPVVAAQLGVEGAHQHPPLAAEHGMAVHGRRHLHDLRYLERTNLTGVGGTMLLVQADVHRAGIVFPEIPYDDLIETEGFGKLACDFGIVPVGLPNLEIRHVPE